MSPAPTLPPGFQRAQPTQAPISQADLERAYAVASLACDRARQEILPRFRKVAVETKSDGSPVTEADLAAERVIRETLREAFPEDALLGEEFGEESGQPADPAAPSAPGAANGRRRWIIDPIDGTLAFSRGIPLFTTLIALLIDDEPVLGMIDLPALDDRVGAFRGSGLRRTLGHAGVSSPAPAALENALVCHGDLFCFENAGLRPLYDALSRSVGILRGYTDAFGHLLVLTGAADAMVDCDLNPWDAAATRLLTLEAGGECWLREREGGTKLDLIFGSAATVQAIGNCAAAEAPR